ncbi:MAG: Secretion ATPase PEP-CTERM locus [Desulfobulbaceae bacterium]|nr:MAG: Secretion ATPase PEP-CTERM locus [Desulfobulbaceae bacterium]
MYEKFFGFTEKPFQLVPNPNFLYLSTKHQNALTYLEYGLSEGSGFILLTGDIGAGKTTLVRYLLNKVEKDIEVGVLFNTNVDSDELLALVMQEFGLTSSLASKSAYLDIIFHHLIERYAHGKRVLLIIDEAQSLSVSALEEVRMLSNLQTDDQLLLQVMLVGQPELKRKLNAKGLTQLSQRIGVHYHLGTLSHEETREYIAFRLQKVGDALDIFDEGAMDLVFQASQGIPRVVNLLCDTALVYAYGESASRIGADVVSQVIRDKEGFGLIQQGQVDEPAVPTEAIDLSGVAFVDQDPRIAALEAKVNWLQVQIESQLTQANERGVQSTERLIAELSGLVTKEREKSEKLLLERGKLLATIDEHQRRARSESPYEISLVAEESAQKSVPERSAEQESPAEPKEKKWYQRIAGSIK